MEHEIVNPYRDAYILREPVLKSLFTRQELLSLLEEAATFIFPPLKERLEHIRSMVSIRLFQRFLDLSMASEVTVDEAFLEDFRSSFQNHLRRKNGRLYSRREAVRAVDRIRYLINEYFYPRKRIIRKILGRKIYLKYQRFLSLSETTQKLILIFESDGRKVKATRKYFEDSKGRESFRLQVRRKAERLSACNRQSIITAALTILSALHKEGIEDIERNDLERLLEIYREQNKKETAKNYLTALFSLVANGIDLGIFQKNPFDNLMLEKRTIKSRRDFVMPDQIERLLDLKLLDWNKPKDVRGRCLTMLVYDTGLRASAMTKLRLQDLHEIPDGRYRLAIKGKYLKGDKEDMVLYILFRETISLLRQWVHVIRPQFHPKTDHLFVSMRGKPLTSSGVRDLICDCCMELGIRTFQGRTPSPHTFRHTLPTLNTDPYGKRLSPRLMQQRLGHRSFETFERIYVHNNPLSEMKEYKRLYIRDSKENLFDEVSKEDFFRILDSLSFVKPASICEVKEAYERKIATKGTDANNPIQWDKALTEGQAVSALSPFQVDYRSLRSWGLKEGICRVIEEKGRRSFVYDKDRISNLIETYLTSEQALKKFHGSRSDFYRRLEKCHKVVIGRRTFIPKDDYFQFLLPDGIRYTIGSKKDVSRYVGV